MIDVQMVDRAEFKRHQLPYMTEANMAQEPEDPDAAADRLEAALERIATLAAVPPAAKLNAPPADADLSIPEIAERLDQLISRLRAALGKPD